MSSTEIVRAGTAHPVPGRGGDGVPGTCVATLDPALRVVSANDELHRYIGPRDEPVTGSAFCDMLHPSARERARQVLHRLVNGERSRTDETSVVLMGDDGSYRGAMSASALSRTAGRVESVVAVLTLEDGEAAMSARPRKVLSEMDARILEGVASGASTVQLASLLFLSRGGVEYHVTSLLRRMKVKNRPALVSKAYSMGYFEVGSWPPSVAEEHVK